jgi:hypothetical protein
MKTNISNEQENAKEISKENKINISKLTFGIFFYTVKP